MKLAYGLEDGLPYSYSEIERITKCPRDLVSSMVASALHRFRRSTAFAQLNEEWDDYPDRPNY